MRIWGGTSGSVATLVMLKTVSALMVWSPTGLSVGAVLLTATFALLLVTEPAMFDTITK